MAAIPSFLTVSACFSLSALELKIGSASSTFSSATAAAGGFWAAAGFSTGAAGGAVVSVAVATAWEFSLLRAATAAAASASVASSVVVYAYDYSGVADESASLVSGATSGCASTVVVVAVSVYLSVASSVVVVYSTPSLSSESSDSLALTWANEPLLFLLAMCFFSISSSASFRDSSPSSSLAFLVAFFFDFYIFLRDDGSLLVWVKDPFLPSSAPLAKNLSILTIFFKKPHLAWFYISNPDIAFCAVCYFAYNLF